MKSTGLRKMIVALIAVALGVSGNPLFALDTPGPRPLPDAKARIRDVLLSERGVVELQLVDSQGQGLKNVPVTVKFQDRIVAQATTGENGLVSLEKIRPGQHTVHAGAGIELVRVWQPSAAPPSAVNRLAIVSDERVVRGQPGSTPSNPGQTTISPGGALTILSLVGAGVALAEIESQKDDIKSLQSQVNALASP